MTATFVGGRGNEWLAGGGFQPDGTVVLAGNVAGPVLELPVPSRFSAPTGRAAGV